MRNWSPFGWRRRHSARKPVRRESRTRLWLEGLEDRCLPTATFYGSFSMKAEYGGYSVVGDGRLAQITVLLSTGPIVGPTTGEHPNVSIGYATTSGGTATSADYIATSGTVSFATGIWSASFTVSTVPRTSSHGDKTVNLTLSAVPQGGMQPGDPSTSVLHITDPPPLPTVHFAAPNTQTVIESGTTQATATITVDGTVNPISPVIVTWGAGRLGDTARPVTDYQIISPTTLTFNSAGSQTVTVNCPTPQNDCHFFDLNR